MKSPLAVYKETVAKYKLDDVEVSAVQKLSFLETQKQEIQGALWRATVDILHAKRLQESENPVLQAKGNNNFAKELRKEYAEDLKD
jgi:hypothetical protein